MFYQNSLLESLPRVLKSEKRTQGSFNLFNITNRGLINKDMQHLFNTVPQLAKGLTMCLPLYGEGH